MMVCFIPIAFNLQPGFRLFFFCIHLSVLTLSELVTELPVDESTMSLSSYVVHGLQPDTLYEFYAVSLTAAGPSYKNSNLVEARTEGAGLHAGYYAAIGLAALFLLLFVAIGAVTCIK